MPRTLALAALISLAAVTAAPAEAPQDQLLALVSAELPAYVPDVDTAQLSRHQLAAIYSILHSGKSGGDKIAMIRSVLGGGYSLRSLLFN